MDHEYIDFAFFTELCYDLLNRVRETGKIYRSVLCPLRGGFYLSYFMSRHLDIPMTYIEISSYKGKKQETCSIGLQTNLEEGHFLLCDDIYDSGTTIQAIHEIYPHVHFDAVCLVSKVKDAHVMYGKHVESNWIDFFWEVM